MVEEGYITLPRSTLYTLHSTLYTLHTFAHFPPAAGCCCPRQPVSGCWPGARPPPPPPLARPPAASPSYPRLRGLQPPQLTSSLQPRGPASLLPRVTAPRQRDLAVSALSPRVGAGCGLAVCSVWLRASMVACLALPGDVATSAAAWRLVAAVCAVAGNSGRLPAASQDTDTALLSGAHPALAQHRGHRTHHN